MTYNTLNSTHLPNLASNGNGNPLHDVAESVRSSGESTDTLGLPMLRNSTSNDSLNDRLAGQPENRTLAENLSISGGPMYAARIDVQEEVIMRAGKTFLGLSVVGQADGTDLGHVRDLILNPETDQLVALVLVDKDLFGLIDAQIVPWDEVHTLGPDAVLVRSAASNIKLKDYDPLQTVTHQRASLLSGMEIVTADGRRLGALADICIDELSGRVIGYEVSTGFIADSLQGKKFLPAPPTLTIGQDAAIAPADAITLLK